MPQPVAGVVTSSDAVACTIPARGSGMRVVELAIAKGGEISRSGKQVEVVPVATVASVTPIYGVASGSTVVTLAGSNFVAGRTACKFGSAAAVDATVMSSTEAVCVAPAATRGSVTVEMITNYEGQILTSDEVSTSSKQFTYVSEVSMKNVVPGVATVEGGSMLSVSAAGLQGADQAWCKLGSVVVAAKLTSAEMLTCMSIAGVEGNMTVELSVNGKDFTTDSNMMNVTSITETVGAISLIFTLSVTCSDTTI